MIIRQHQQQINDDVLFELIFFFFCHLKKKSIFVVFLFTYKEYIIGGFSYCRKS
jgi:hypothetical protein